MTTPNLNLLKEITQLASELEVLDNKVSKLEEERDLKNSVNESKVEDLKAKYIRDRKDIVDLDAVKSDLTSLRELENKLRSTLEFNINNAVDSFVNGGKYTEFVSTLLSKLTEEDSSASLFIGSEAKSIVNLASQEAVKSNQIRIEAKGRIYDLTPSTIIPLLKKKLLIQLLTSN